MLLKNNLIEFDDREQATIQLSNTTSTSNIIFAWNLLADRIVYREITLISLRKSR